MIKVTIFNEYMHEQIEDKVRENFPKGIHSQLASFLQSDEVQVRCVTQYDENQELIPDCGLTEEVLKDTDVIIWWGHMRHKFVPDEVVERVHNHILCGMGAIFLHSGHHSKVFKKLMGTTCNLSWRDGAKERLWNINPAHPIMEGVPQYIDLPEEEMYGECFEIPQPNELLMIGTYNSHEVFRSACTWQRVNGRIFYLQPGHETNRAYYNPDIQRIIKNAVKWVNPTYRVEKLEAPNVSIIEF